MNSVVEKQRLAHEEIERIQEQVALELSTRHKKHLDRLIQQHRIKKHLDKIQSLSQFLIDAYADVNGIRKYEIAQISNAANVTDFTRFYDDLKEVKDFHKRHDDDVKVVLLELEVAKVDEEREFEEIENMFSGEETRGRFLDLNAPFELYVNLKQVKRINYLAYIESFDKFDEDTCGVPAETRKTGEYKRYLNELVGYLEGFCQRALPLLDLDALRESALADANEWASSQDVDMDADPALFCHPCAKLFTKKSIFDGHLSGRKHKKAVEAFQVKGGQLDESKQTQVIQSQLETQKQFKVIEYTVHKLGESLAQQREDTRDFVERKQTLSADEIEKAKASYDIQDYTQEAEEDYNSGASDAGVDEDDNNEIYNPLKLPMGWDGKPIPYWLFKLHGLGVEYPCEICGNFVYMGRKAFDRHFQEWRHAHGMKCLGIPNTKHFQEITGIQDAYSLWEKLNTAKKAEAFKADAMEEFEDAEGNVFNKKTFEDLRRQGLL
ncbi:UNVERIFIED_CONTAM: hypothetical protein HDU68_011385 [Siphonaria sp. JEL0065]|nr:hypothetical protein HDU68_011385 [Siphonaria sp. JEL0065]